MEKDECEEKFNFLLNLSSVLNLFKFIFPFHCQIRSSANPRLFIQLSWLSLILLLLSMMNYSHTEKWVFVILLLFLPFKTENRHVDMEQQAAGNLIGGQN